MAMTCRGDFPSGLYALTRPEFGSARCRVVDGRSGVWVLTLGSGTVEGRLGNFESGQPHSSKASKLSGKRDFMVSPDAIILRAFNDRPGLGVMPACGTESR